jgi:putative addiction module component (TIGR02574 family)
MNVALALSPAERFEVVEELMGSFDSLDDDLGSTEVEAAWAEELLRRKTEAEQNPEVLVTWAKAREQMFGKVP